MTKLAVASLIERTHLYRQLRSLGIDLALSRRTLVARDQAKEQLAPVRLDSAACVEATLVSG